MKKKINVVVAIDKTEMTEEEKLEKLARYCILLNKWKCNNKTNNLNKSENKEDNIV